MASLTTSSCTPLNISDVLAIAPKKMASLFLKSHTYSNVAIIEANSNHVWVVGVDVKAHHLNI